MTSSTYSADAAPEAVSLSSGQAKFLYWFVGTVPILKALTPISTHLGNTLVALGTEAVKAAEKAAKESGNPELIKKATLKHAAELYKHVISDVSRQTATCSLQLVSYFVVGDMIKAGLKKHYSKQPLQAQDLGYQQVISQVVPLLAQVVATILSRGLGASQLQKLLEQSADGKIQTVPASEKLRTKVNSFINHTFRDHKTQVLKPLKASLFATSGMMVYFGLLVGGLYGLSTLLEKVLPEDYKPKKGKRKPTTPPAATLVPASALNRVLPAPDVSLQSFMRPQVVEPSPSLYPSPPIYPSGVGFSYPQPRPISQNGSVFLR